MFSSLFGSAPEEITGPNVHLPFPLTANAQMDGQLMRPLTKEDNEWRCQTAGFVTETMTWYDLLADGSILTCQIIHSSLGSSWIPPTTVFTFRLVNPLTGLRLWKSINATRFAPDEADRRSCRADEFSVTYAVDPSNPSSSSSSAKEEIETYSVRANLDTDLQINLTFTKPAAASCKAFKVGNAETIFGTDPSKPDGLVFHHFWPRLDVTGTILHQNKLLQADGTGTFIHAVQGMRPNLIAKKWNFIMFHSPAQQGTTAILMEFETPENYGDARRQTQIDLHAAGKPSTGTKVLVGAVLARDQPPTIVGDAYFPSSEPSPTPDSKRTFIRHNDGVHDPETGYDAPRSIDYHWASGARLHLDLSPPSEGQEGNGVTGHGLLEKIDVMAEIPYVIKKVVSVVAGTKPFIYQYLNPATLILPDGTEVQGTALAEATFVSS